MAKAKAKTRARARAEEGMVPGRVPGDIVHSSTGKLYFIPLGGGDPQAKARAEIPGIARDLGTDPPLLENMLSKGPGIWPLKR